jgi:putative PIG3 family NAD(P)H quinone oxidoreductase
MRAIVITRFGGPEVLQIREVPEPPVGPEDVVVRVRAAGVNRADLLQRRGLYPAPPGSADDIPGLEFAGEIEGCGAGVRTLQVGDRVMGIVGGGGYADKVVLHERLCLRIPPALSWENAGATPEAFLTAYDALFRCGSLSAGELVLLQAAGSGVGTAAAQLALVAGSRVIGLSRTPDKRRRLRKLGLQQVFDPDAPDLADAILAATGGEGIDLVLDLIGAPAWPLHLAVLRERGRVVIIGLMGGSRLEIDLFQLMRKRLTVTGSVLRSRGKDEKASLVREFAERVVPLMTLGRVSPIVHCTMEMSEAADAHRLMERNENFGKIVLRP